MLVEEEEEGEEGEGDEEAEEVDKEEGDEIVVSMEKGTCRSGSRADREGRTQEGGAEV